MTLEKKLAQTIILTGFIYFALRGVYYEFKSIQRDYKENKDMEKIIKKYRDNMNS